MYLLRRRSVDWLRGSDRSETARRHISTTHQPLPRSESDAAGTPYIFRTAYRTRIQVRFCQVSFHRFSFQSMTECSQQRTEVLRITSPPDTHTYIHIYVRACMRGTCSVPQMQYGGTKRRHLDARRGGGAAWKEKARPFAPKRREIRIPTSIPITRPVRMYIL